MIKVLEIIDGETFGGITKLILDMSKYIKNIDIDFLTHVPLFDKNVKKAYTLNISRKSLKGKLIYNYRLYKFLRARKYDIVHIHSGVFLYSFQVVVIAKIAGVKKIIVHSHNTPYISWFRKVIKKILNPLYRKLTHVHFTCSTEAAYSLFTKIDDVILLKNGIETNKFKYNENIRKKLRKQFNIENKKVYGHIGRFSKQKNHEFLIDLFYEIQKHEDNSVLLLVGNGELEIEIREKVKNLNLKDKVIFLGFQKNIADLLCSIDVFIFPSLYEGFPVSLVEALASGLPVFVSKAVSDDVNISENFHKIYSFNIDDWIKQILSTKGLVRDNAYINISKQGYDIKDVSKQLESIYKDLIK